jgi:hypothetical protein
MQFGTTGLKHQKKVKESMKLELIAFLADSQARDSKGIAVPMRILQRND